MVKVAAGKEAVGKEAVEVGIDLNTETTVNQSTGLGTGNLRKTFHLVHNFGPRRNAIHKNARI